MATFPAKTNYAAGNVLTAAQMVDIGEQINALNGNAGKNKIINGDFGIWQRGTSFSGLATDAYFADRWGSNWNAGTGSNTFSQQTFTPGTAPVAGYEGQFFARCAVTGANSSTQIGLRQRIEDVRTFAGQTMTISFWAKADASRSVNILTQQNFGSGGSAEVYGTATSVSVTTSWARYSATFSIPSISGKTIGTSSFFGVFIYLPIGSLSGSANLDVWGVQAEVGSVATAFQTATGTLAGERSACERYYYRTDLSSNAYTAYGAGMATSGSDARIYIKFPTTMRVTPTSIDAANLAVTDFASYTRPVTVTINEMNNVGGTVRGTDSGVGMTTYRPGFLTNNNNTTGYLGFSAEL